MNLLTVPIMDMEQWLRDNYTDNPLLKVESEDDFESLEDEESFEDNLRDYSIDTEPGKGNIIEDLSSDGDMSLQSHLFNQIKYMAEDEDETELSLILIGELNEDGFLDLPVSKIADDYGVDENKLRWVLENIVQELDPPGVGARNRRELIKLQLTPEQRDNAELQTIIENHLQNILEGDYEPILSKMGIDIDKIEEYAELIDDLNRNPSSIFSTDDVSKSLIIPDLIVEEKDGEPLVRLNQDKFPEVGIDESYIKMLNERELSDKDKNYIKKLHSSAEDVLYALKMRMKTLLQIGMLIVDEQSEFFQKGLEGLKPMTFSAASEKLGFAVSTVSRATSGKYIDTPFGIFPLRLFFSREVDDMSRTLIFIEMRDIVENEEEPLTDKEIADELEGRGISISRRTVNKYRKKLGIPSSHKRRRIAGNEV